MILSCTYSARWHIVNFSLLLYVEWIMCAVMFCDMEAVGSSCCLNSVMSHARKKLIDSHDTFLNQVTLWTNSSSILYLSLKWKIHTASAELSLFTHNCYTFVGEVTDHKAHRMSAKEKTEKNSVSKIKQSRFSHHRKCGTWKYLCLASCMFTPAWTNNYFWFK